MSGQHKDQDEQSCHHPFCDLFKSVLKSPAADKESGNDCYCHPETHLAGIAEHFPKYSCYLVCIHSGESSCRKLYKVAEHPAGNRRVIHHQKITADHTEPSVYMPPASRLFKCLVSTDSTLSSRTTNRKFHCKDRNAHTEQKQQIEQDEYSAAVLSRHIREPPYVSDSDRAARAHQ